MKTNSWFRYEVVIGTLLLISKTNLSITISLSLSLCCFDTIKYVLVDADCAGGRAGESKARTSQTIA